MSIEVFAQSLGIKAGSWTCGPASHASLPPEIPVPEAIPQSSYHEYNQRAQSDQPRHYAFGPGIDRWIPSENAPLGGPRAVVAAKHSLATLAPPNARASSCPGQPCRRLDPRRPELSGRRQRRNGAARHRLNIALGESQTTPTVPEMCGSEQRRSPLWRA
jgi:hypothetical protein